MQQTIKKNYEFTNEERQAMAKDLAKHEIDKNQIEDEKKSVMSGFKEKIDSLETKIKKLSHLVNNGYEERMYECNVVIDFDKKSKTFIDVVSGEVIDERVMDDAEYQMELDFAAEKDDEGIDPEDESGDQPEEIQNDGETPSLETNGQEKGGELNPEDETQPVDQDEAVAANSEIN